LVLGDDNLTICRGRLTELGVARLQEGLTSSFRSYGFEAKVKVSNHIVHAEYCSQIFAPIVGGSLVLIPKPMRLALKFNKVKQTSIDHYGGNVE
jgi:hypothetical protein